AGPVVAGAVVLAPGVPIAGAADSKVLDPVERERLAALIRTSALAVGIGSAAPEEIDRLNIRRAAFLAMRRALEALDPVIPDYVLVDGREIPGLGTPQTAYVKGDTFVCSIAAASIVAKVHRDALMVELDERVPADAVA